MKRTGLRDAARDVALSLLASLSAPTPLFASSLEGRLLLRDGRPAQRAEVSILDRTGTALTDAEGRFTWSPAPQPPFELLVVLAGGTFVKPLRVEALPHSGPLELVVEPAVIETVTVTAGLAPHVSPPPAAGTTLLAAREIALRQPANLSQVLENVAGVASLSEGQAAVPAIRGFARGRTLILIDGARVTAERRVGPSATYLDPVVLESVEVARGPGSVAYGSDAFGGVIDARTRRARPGEGTSGRFVGDLGLGIAQQRAALELAHGFAQGGLLAQAHYRNFDDYTSPEGEVLDSGSRDYGARARLDHALGGGTLSLAWQSDLGRDIERPRTNSTTTRFLYPQEDSHRFVASWDTGSIGSWSRVGASAFLSSYALVTDQDTLATAEEPRSVERADVSARDFHLRGVAARALGGARLELGLDWNGRFDLEALDVYRFYDASGSLEREQVNVSIENARRDDYAAYATVGAAAGRRVTLDAGLRADAVRARDQGGYFGDHASDHTALSGFGAFGLAVTDAFSATAQLSRGFRDPMLSDRYFRGPTGRGYITGNPELEPETSLQLDLALRYSAAHWRAAAYLFDYRIDELIERYESEPDFFYFRNRGRARLRGMELELQAQPLVGLTLELAGHLIRGEAEDDGTPLDDVPPATLTLKATRSFAHGFVQVRGALYARDDRPGPNEVARDGYGLLDVAGGWCLGDSVELRLLARNLLDARYEVSPDRRAVLAPGRSLQLTAVVAF
jgi:outer membrane receptor protein involved in Fe transport